LGGVCWINIFNGDTSNSVGAVALLAGRCVETDIWYDRERERQIDIEGLIFTHTHRKYFRLQAHESEPM
jgi:hypothetical protein